MSKGFKVFTGIVWFLILAAVFVYAQAIHHEARPWSFATLILNAGTAGQVTIPVSGSQIVSSYTVSTPDKSHISFTCADTDGCNVYCGETGAQQGQLQVLSNRGANTVTVRDVPTTGCNLSGNAALGVGDSVSTIYDNGQFIQFAPESDN